MSALIRRFKHIFPNASPSILALAAFSAWCAACGAFACTEKSFKQISFAPSIPLLPLLGLTAVLTLLFFWGGSQFPKYLYRISPVTALFYGVVCAFRSASFYTAFGFLILLAILIVHTVREDRMALDQLRLSPLIPRIAVILFAVLMATYLIAAALMRYYSYNAPCYDFGIFCQMFHSMKTTGLPVTTCERSTPMSHFAVHVSPIYYVLLPFYMIVPRPETLLVLQVIAVLSGVIPLWLLGRHFRLSERVGAVLCLMYLGCAALTGGIFYDLHENKMLTPLLLWLFWGVEKKNRPLILLFTLLTLTVKEDAALYIIFIGIWLLLSRPQKNTGALMTAGAVGYFLTVTSWLANQGEGVMFNRFSNIIGSEGGIVQLIRSALVNPALLLYECMNTEKLVFAACIILPLGFLPFFTKKLSDLLLLCPFVIMNLISDYAYQHNLNYQYTYGVMALLFYLCVANLPHIPNLVTGFRLRRALLCFALCATALIGAVQVKNHIPVFTEFDDMREDSKIIREVLSTIPEDASIRTASMFVAHLAAREEIYYITTEAEADIVLIDLRPYIGIPSAEGYEVEYFERRGYHLVLQIDNVIAMLQKAP